MKTLIISGFPGVGKSFFAKKTVLSENISVVDKDNGLLKTKYEFYRYSKEIMQMIGTTDFLLISQYPEVLEILYKNKVPFIIVAPNNHPLTSLRNRTLIKQQWFGRFLLRKNSSEWIRLLKENYEKWSSLEHLKSMHPHKIILLNGDEYLSDIIDELLIYKKLYGIDFIDNCKDNLT